MENKEKDVVVRIREMGTGEEPEGFVCAAAFKDFKSVEVHATRSTQVALIEKLVNGVGKQVAKMDDKMASASFVAMVFSALKDSVGMEAIEDGVKLMKMALNPSPETIRKLMKIVDKAMKNALKDGDE